MYRYGLLVGLFCLTACSGLFGPIQGYQGEPRADQSKVVLPLTLYALDQYSQESRVERVVGEFEVPRAGVLLTPGSHTFSFRFLRRVGEESCTYSVDWYYPPNYFYRRSVYYPWHSQRSQALCRVEAVEASCSGRFETEASKSYAMELREDGSAIELYTTDNVVARTVVGTCISGATVTVWKRESW